MMQGSQSGSGKSGGGGLFAALNRSLGMARQKPAAVVAPPPGHIVCARAQQSSSPPHAVSIDDLLAIAPTHLATPTASAAPIPAAASEHRIALSTQVFALYEQ